MGISANMCKHIRKDSSRNIFQQTSAHLPRGLAVWKEDHTLPSAEGSHAHGGLEHTSVGGSYQRSVKFDCPEARHDTLPSGHYHVSYSEDSRTDHGAN